LAATLTAALTATLTLTLIWALALAGLILLGVSLSGRVVNERRSDGHPDCRIVNAVKRDRCPDYNSQNQSARENETTCPSRHGFSSLPLYTLSETPVRIGT
jgi:hypothetical protein